MTKLRCIHCGTRFIPAPQVPNQAYCSKANCQKERRRQWHKNKLLPIATKNFLIEIGEQFSKIKTSHHQSNTLLPGTTLIREFDGQQYRVQVIGKNRFEINGQTFKSLSAIAQMISGTSVSGQAWFGLAGEQ